MNNRTINFRHLYIFNDFRKYEYDFYLTEHNICIEYDGVQHFKPNNYFGGIKAFEEQKIRDKEKDEYCLKNNIKLIRIPYTEKDIEKILENEFTH